MDNLITTGPNSWPTLGASVKRWSVRVPLILFFVILLVRYSLHSESGQTDRLRQSVGRFTSFGRWAGGIAF